MRVKDSTFLFPLNDGDGSHLNYKWSLLLHCKEMKGHSLSQRLPRHVDRNRLPHQDVHPSHSHSPAASPPSPGWSADQDQLLPLPRSTKCVALSYPSVLLS